MATSQGTTIINLFHIVYEIVLRVISSRPMLLEENLFCGPRSKELRVHYQGPQPTLLIYLESN
jgi:hypothetical protein